MQTGLLVLVAMVVFFLLLLLVWGLKNIQAEEKNDKDASGILLPLL